MKKEKLYSFKTENVAGLIILFIIIPILWFFLPMLLFAVSEMTVTNRRVRIKQINGTYTELPVDSIGALRKTFWFGKLSIRTSSGVISVWGFSDRDEVFNILSNLMIKRQEEQVSGGTETLPEL